MELAFSSKDLRKVCEDSEVAETTLSTSAAIQLTHRLTDLRAAEHVGELLVGNPRLSESKELECYLIDLADNFKLIIASNHAKTPTRQDGAVDWQHVSRIIILEITQNYD